MAGIGMLIRGPVVNALAFSGSNYLFHMLGGSDEERKSHDRAIEQLQAAQAAWSWWRTERLDWINEELRRQAHAVRTLRDIDVVVREYSQVTGHNLDLLGPEPQLSDFHQTSDDQKDREITFIVLGMGTIGILAYWISKRSAE